MYRNRSLITLLGIAAITLATTAPAAAGTASPAQIYRWTMNSIHCADRGNAGVHFGRLANALKSTPGLDADTAAKDAKGAVESWCSRQLARQTSPAKQAACVDKYYNSAMLPFIQGVFAGESQTKLGALFTTRDIVRDVNVWPQCDIGPSDNRRIRALSAAKPAEPPAKPATETAAKPVGEAKPADEAKPAAKAKPAETTSSTDTSAQPAAPLANAEAAAAPPSQTEPPSTGPAPIIDNATLVKQKAAVAPLEAPTAPIIETEIGSQARNTEEIEAQRQSLEKYLPGLGIVHTVSDRVSDIRQKVEQTIASGDKGGMCPLSDDFARWMSEGDLLTKGGHRVSKAGVPVDLEPCKSPAPFDQYLLNEAQIMANELPKLQQAAPKGSVFRQKGGGFRQGHDELRGDGVNMPMMAGDKTIFPGNPNAASYCSGGITTLLTRALGRVDNGLIFSEMFNSDEFRTKGRDSQLENFIPFRKGRDGAFHRNLNDSGTHGQGVFGVINADGDGIWDLNQDMARGGHQFGNFVNIPADHKRGIYDRHPFTNACAGNLMAFNRGYWQSGGRGGRDTWHATKGGHTTMYLGKVINKHGKEIVYYWGSNRGTKGYGVTCDEADRIQPNIIAIKDPYQFAAIPNMNGQNDLASAFNEDRYRRVIEKRASLLRAAPAPNSSPLTQGAIIGTNEAR